MAKVKFNGNYYSTFAVRLRDLISEKGITNTDLAKELDIVRQSVSQYADGSSQPTADKLVKMAQFFNVSIDYLLGLSDAKTNDPELIKICDYTGLSKKAIANIKFAIEQEKGFMYLTNNSISPINTLLESSFTQSFSLNTLLLSSSESKLIQVMKQIRQNIINDSIDSDMLNDIDLKIKAYILKCFKSQNEYTTYYKEILKKNSIQLDELTNMDLLEYLEILKTIDEVDTEVNRRHYKYSISKIKEALDDLLESER